MNRLPVTLVGGFLGAGKTSLLHHFISEHRGGHLAVLVENPGALNLDAKALRGLCGAMRRTNDAVFEIPDGDPAAQITAIAHCLRDLAESGRYERVLIEVAGTANPAWLARHFGIVAGQPKTFSPWAELHQNVCVVDALDFGSGKWPTSEATFSQFKHEQIAGASLIVFNKSDLIDDHAREFCLDILRGLNEVGYIVETTFGEVLPNAWTRRVQMQKLGLEIERSLQQKNIDKSEVQLASALYRVHRPFHPTRFWDWFNADHPGLLRVKGLVWLATRNLLVGGVSRTRWQNACGPAGIWWAALPREEWPQEPDALMRMQETWREPYGDRRQELVLIGDAAPLSTTMRRQLDACLLTDEEYARPLGDWAALPDPFPAWDLSEE